MSQDADPTESPQARSFPCGQCGAKLEYDPGSRAQKCPYCGHETAVPRSEEDIEELDFHEYFEKASSGLDQVEAAAVKCGGCGATTTFDRHVESDACAFCGIPLIAQEVRVRVIRPHTLLPFQVSEDQAHQAFRAWLGGLWFAPGALRQYARRDHALQGMYLPYWTYDAKTTSFYRGERGDDYWVTETYRKPDGSSGTRSVRKTRWTSVSGTVWRHFNDVLVLASRSVPPAHAEKLEPWDLRSLEPFREEYLAGFRAESYQVDLGEGFGRAKEIMAGPIAEDARRDIGGDHQRVHSIRTQYDSVTFKHLLLPVWVSAYRYRERAYRFLVNGRTGEVQGDRPWSVLKIALAVLAGAAILALLLFAFSKMQ